MRLVLDRLRMDDNFRIMNAIAPTEPAQQSTEPTRKAIELTPPDGGGWVFVDRSKANTDRGGRFSRRGPAAEDAAAELFGRRRGAAVGRRRGALLRAVQGTRIFLGYDDLIFELSRRRENRTARRRTSVTDTLVFKTAWLGSAVSNDLFGRMRVSIAVLAGTAGAFSTSRNALVAPRRPAAASSQLQMLDAAVIQGGAAAVGGLAVGLGMAWFSEQQVEQGEQRGSDAVSEATRAKMSAMFMEDEVLPDTTLDDTVLRMEAALAAAKGEAAAEEKVEEKPSSSIDDGW